MRVDTNISIRPIGSIVWNQDRMKNINSFNYVRKALAFEEKRHQNVIMSGGQIAQETRR